MDPSPTPPAVHLTLTPTRTLAMDAPQTRTRPPQLLSSKPNQLISSSSSATTSPSHDDFSFPSPPFGVSGHLLPLSMSRTPVGRVGSDLSHLSRHTTTSHHHHTTTSSKDRDSKNKASPAFFSGLAAAWRKDNSSSSSSSSDVTAGIKQRRQAEEKSKDRAAAKWALDDVGQWVKRHMASMVEQLRLRASFFSRHHQSERERQRWRRPHSFSGHGPGAVREMRERERWRRRRRDQLSSAPASLRVSPANSGHLSVGGSVKVSTSSEESTMEELHSAIEAAIAHCKSSISVAKHTAAAAAVDNAKLQ